MNIERLKELSGIVAEAGPGPDVQDYERKLNTIADYLAALTVHEAKKMSQDPDLEGLQDVLKVIEKDLMGKAKNKLEGKMYKRSQQRKK